MNSSCFRRLCRALMILAIASEFSASAQTAAAPATIVFSNTRPAVIPRRMSIILVVADGLGYGDLSCYGQTNFQTQNLDKLAAEGIRFTNYTAEADATASEAALMLGKTPSATPRALGAADVTIAQRLAAAGYHTGLIGDWTLGDEHSGAAPWQKGFDEFAGYLDADAAALVYADYIFRYAPRAILTTNNVQEDYVGRETLYTPAGAPERCYVPDLLAKAAGNFIHNNVPDKFNRFRPFFMVVHFPVPGDGKNPPPSDAPFSEESWKPAEKNRAAAVTRLDGYLGQLREQLAKERLTNNVTIFFTSDSPTIDPAAAFFQSNAGTNDLRVPMIMYGPMPVPGRVSDLKWSGKDFAPTAADIGFARPLTGVDGTSVLRALTKRD